MGRKGLGKLAAFGVAQRVTVRSKRKGDSYASEFTMDYDEIKDSKLHEVPFIPRYEDGLPTEEHGTRITLECLRCDSVSAGKGGVSSSIRDNFFGIEESEFAIQINGNSLEHDEPIIEFTYPEDRGSNDLSELEVTIPEDMGSFPIFLKATFRASVEGKRSHLSGAKRGARIYCNGRLAAGPTLANLHSGVHNFGSTAYMEVIVKADELDDLGIDLINTNRTDFRRDNDIVTSLLDNLTAFMTRSLAAHSRYRDALADKEYSESSVIEDVEAQLKLLPSKARNSARKIVKLLAKAQGVNSNLFKETIPLVLQSVNTGDVLVKLIEMGDRDVDLKEIIRELARLAEIERSDSLKIYRGRKNAVLALQKLIVKGDENWKKNPQFENQLHDLIENNPWILSEEFGRYITSDQQMATTLKRIEDQLKINKFADAMKPLDRPDLVFLLGDSAALKTVLIVELKSPNIPLTIDHWTQLEGYINEVEQFCKSDVSQDVKVSGYLIGTLPDQNTRNTKESLILKKHRDRSLQSQIEIITPTDLANNALTSNDSVLKVLEIEEIDDDSLDLG